MGKWQRSKEKTKGPLRFRSSCPSLRFTVPHKEAIEKWLECADSKVDWKLAAKFIWSLLVNVIPQGSILSPADEERWSFPSTWHWSGNSPVVGSPVQERLEHIGNIPVGTT